MGKYHLSQRTMIKLATSDTIGQNTIQYSIDNAVILSYLKQKYDKIANYELDLLASAAIGVSPLHNTAEPSFIRTNSHFIIHGAFNDRGQRASIVIPIANVETMDDDTTQEEYEARVEKLEAMAVQLAGLLVG